MPENPVIEAKERAERGSRAARRLRSRGLVPGVIYGSDAETEALSVEAERLYHMIEERVRIVDVKIGSKTRPAVIKHIQFDHLDSDIQHVDFELVKMDELLEIEVLVETHGTPKGAKNGGVLEVILKRLRVECKPGDIPREILLEVGELEIGDTITVADIVLPERVKVLEEPTTPLVAVHPPRGEEEVEEVSEEEMMEPKLIGAESEEAGGEGDEDREA